MQARRTGKKGDSILIKRLIELFSCVELKSDTAHNSTDIKVLINSCNTFEELKTLWSELNTAGAFNKVNEKQAEELTRLKDKMKARLSS